MDNPEPTSGDLVIDLAFLLRSSATLSGVVAAATSVWFLGYGVVPILVAALLGGAGGFLAGSLVRFLHFPAVIGLVTVVKAGPGALPTCFKSAFAGGVTTGMLAAVIPAMLLPGDASFGQLIGIGVVAGLTVGGTGACLVTRP